jgi:twitching motility protein PilT
VVSQALFKRVDVKGRIAVLEILIATHAVRAMIRESKTHQLPSALQTGKKYGMQTLDDAIMTHLKSGRISGNEAYMRCVDKEKFRDYLTEQPDDFTEI